MIDLHQKELAERQKEYFGESNLSDMIHGMSEEIGEFNHWYLKSKQKIVTSDKALAEMADAFGDMVIFGTQAMSSLNLNAEMVLERIINEVLNRDWRNRLQ